MAKQRNPERPGGKSGNKKKQPDNKQPAAEPSPPKDDAAWAEGERGHGMDAVSAHLDRGWDLLQRSDLLHAKMSAEQVLRHDPRSPEAYTLLGAIAAARGNPEEALENYQHAMSIDPAFIDPVLYAVETYMWPLEDYEQALELCEHALDLAEEEDEFLDALLLKAEIEVSLGDDAAAQHTMEELPPADFPEAVYHLRAARTLLDLGDNEEAAMHFEKALERDPEMTEAVHGLGLCAEQREDTKEKMRCFLEVRERDLKEPAPAWGITTERFEALCTESLAGLPERIRELLRNVPIIAADYPAEELVRDGMDPRLLGFFAGTPFPEQSSVGGAPQLTCIYLYQKNIERIARTPAEVEEEVQKTLVHEAGHFFGLSEEELEEMGLG